MATRAGTHTTCSGLEALMLLTVSCTVQHADGLICMDSAKCLWSLAPGAVALLQSSAQEASKLLVASDFWLPTVVVCW